MKKILPIFIIITILLSSCASDEDGSATADPSSSDEAPVKATKTPSAESTPVAATKLNVKEDALDALEISVSIPWYGVEAGLFHIFVSDFNKTNEHGIEVTVVEQGNFTNLYENVNVDTTKPDMVVALPEHAIEWHEQGVTIDLAPYVEDPKYGFDSADIETIFWEQDNVNDAQVAIPAQRTAQLLLWNETWGKELGFDSPPDTPDDFRQQACRAQQAMLKDADPQNDFKGGWLVNTEPMTAYSWLLAFNGGALEGNDYRFLTPKNIESFKFLRELSEGVCSWQNANNAAFAFAGREALFITASLDEFPSVANALADKGSRDVWRAFAFPGVEKDALAIYGSSYAVMNSTDEKQLAAWIFIKYLLENKQDARATETTHLFPLRPSTMELLGDYKKTHPQWAQAIALISEGTMQPKLDSWRKVKIMLGDGFTHMYRVNIPSGQVAMILAQMEATSRDLSD